MAFSRDGRRLASGSWGGSVQLWDAEAGGEPLCTFPESRETHQVVSCAGVQPGRRAAGHGQLRPPRGRVGYDDRRAPAHASRITDSFCASPSARTAGASPRRGEDKTVHVWDAATGREVLGLRGHTGVCGCVAFSPDGLRLASASKDGTIRIWDATPLQDDEGQEALTFTGHSDEIWSLAVSPDGQKIVSAGWSMPAKVWDAQTGQVSAEFSGQRDDRLLRGLAARRSAGRLRRRRTAATSWRRSRSGTRRPDEKSSRSRRGRAGVLRRGVQPRRPIPGHRERERNRASLGRADRARRSARSAPTNGRSGGWSSAATVGTWLRRAATGWSNCGTRPAWTRSKKPASRSARGSQRQCLNVAFSPDGRRLATGGEENTVKIWDVQTGQELQTLRGHTGDVYAVAFSPDDDGRWVASAGEDSTVKVWDSRDAVQSVRSFRGHTGLVSSLAFSPDGRRLVSGSRDHTVKVWDVTSRWEK